MKDVYALHSILDDAQFPFDPAAYSRFKFGDGAVANAYGTALAEGFITAYGNRLSENEQLVVLPSPYTSIPTASFHMTTAFVKVLNRYLCMRGYSPAETAKIHRYKTYSIDYGALDMESRKALIINDKYHLDKDFLAGKTLIFTDDIRITGSHELIIRNLLNKFELSNDAYFLYYAKLHNQDIHPNIENKLNYHSVHSLHCLESVIASPDFLFNTRVVKYILNAPFAAYEQLLMKQSNTFLEDLADCCISNNYHHMEEYRTNANYLFDHLQKIIPSWQSICKKEKEPTLSYQNSLLA
ncbi:phosphoribosyltransferase family protein [Chitinophaga rhizophila]|uniref:Phosphoribosyltransferase family protein n=1 Tax=Chitinophaga rhizophila TaxID=2866212 RepID=A0ABS7GJ77_9BACT|nr:phosphoribosyltransferase family protein [Chitinophaga rhizophila]MBW8686518.1 phosphoribosyltransferase family protein [Chitinophaga rhizophila]